MTEPSEVPAVRLKKFPVIQPVPQGFIVRWSRRTVRFLVFYEAHSSAWIAQGLEVNFVSCAETRDELLYELARQVEAQEEADREAGAEPFAGFKEAPSLFFRWWTEARLGEIM